MDKEIALVQSKTFWVALLGLADVIAKGLQIPWLYSWAGDPHSVDVALNVVAGGMFLLAMVTRKAATSKATTLFLPPGGDKTLRAAPLAILIAAAATASQGGCNDQVQQALANIQANIKTAEQVAAEDAPQLCADIQGIENAGEIVLTSGMIGASDVQHARTVEAGIDALCVNPSQQNAAAIITRGIAAYATLSTLFKNASAK